VCVVEHIHQHSLVFLEQISHLSRTRMQKVTNMGVIFDGIAKNFYDDIFVLNFSQLINRF
jgi:hypothetical protein